jgi:tetratricopeptide (TPR) repeat protein
VLAGDLSAPAAAQPASAVTFNKDVAPIVFARCASCHRPGEIGPFSLLTYADVKQRATLIADVTARRVMPPWKPNPGTVDYLDSRALSDAEIRTIRRWVSEGAVEGDPADLPQAPERPGEWQLGPPDLVIQMAETYDVPADGPDVFRTFVLPIPMPSPRFVRAMEFRPGNARVVHHANIGVDRSRSSRHLDARDPGPGYSGGMVPDAEYPPGHILGWTPGQRPRPVPPGMSWRLERDSDLIVQLHLKPSGKPERVQARAAFYFTDDPPARFPIGLRLGSQTIDIEAGAPEYVISDSYILPVDAEAWAVQPHAHNLGRTMEASATLPDGTTIPLVSIADWDFRWQDVYRFRKPVVLPKGTRVQMRFTYDNSGANPRNPHQPPRRVIWGQNTSDEMGDLWLQIVPRHDADLATLAADVARKTRAEDLAAYTRLLEQDPGNPLRHDAVAMLYLQDGRPAEAAAEWRESIRLNPDSAPAYYNLGLALSMQRQFDAAMRAFQEAIRIDPGHADALNNLGAMRQLAGRLDEAVKYYRQALALRPENAEARSNLGRVLLTEGQERAAAAEFRQALVQKPDLPSALASLAWVMATSSEPGLRNPEEAVRLAERAASLSPTPDVTTLDALAAAYAGVGRFSQAVATARAALEAAVQAGSQAGADQIRKRLTAYERALQDTSKPR